MTFDSRSVCVSGSVYGNFHCSWIIPNFSSLDSAVGESIDSEYFQLQSYSPRWRLRIYPGGEEDDDEGSISCFLFFSSRDSEKMLVKINSFSLRNIAGKVLSKSESSVELYKAMDNIGSRGYSTILKRDTIVENLIDDVLIFCMSVTYCSTCIKDSTNTRYFAEMSPISTLVENFKSLSSNEEHSDTDILVGKKKIPVNSVILSARSKVFQGMFRNNMKEKKSKSVQITDFDEDIMDAFIQFVYTGNVKFMDTNVAIQLLRASDKYDMDDLMLYCSNYLASNLNEENVIRILIEADMYKAHTLKIKAMKYLSGYRSREIIKKHRLLLKKHPDILLDILEANGS